MQVSVEKVSNVLRRLTIVVPASEVEAAYDRQINRIGKQANIKGFRPGKAPMSFVKQRFGAEARQEALNEIIQTTLAEALKDEQLKDEKLTPISMPQIALKTVQADQPLEYTASFEVLPELSEIKFSLETLEKPQVEVTDSDVNHVLDQLIKQHTEWHVVERPAVLNDRVVIDYHAIYEGKEDIENKVQRFPLELGSKVMIPGFEDGLLGILAGEERNLSLAFPEDFKIEDKAGKPVDFVIKANQVFEANSPAMDEDFIKRLGVETGQLDDLKKQIKDSLTQECNRLVKEKTKEQVFQALIEQNVIDVPDSLVQREAKTIHDEMHPDHHDHHDHSPAELSAFNEIAKKRVILGLLIAEFAKKSNIKPEKDRVEQRIQEIRHNPTAIQRSPDLAGAVSEAGLY